MKILFKEAKSLPQLSEIILLYKYQIILCWDLVWLDKYKHVIKLLSSISSILRSPFCFVYINGNKLIVEKYENGDTPKEKIQFPNSRPEKSLINFSV